MSTQYGLTTEGFNVKRLQEIKEALGNDLRTYFGDDIDLSASSVFGQLVGAFSKPTAEEWEMLQAVYLSLFPSSAEGLQLDNVASINGLVRLHATSTTVKAALFSANCPVVIPQGTILSVNNTVDKFQLETGMTIDGSASACTACIIEVTDNPASSTFTVTVAGEAHVVTSDDPAESIPAIADLIADEINNGALSDSHYAYAPGDGTVEISVLDYETPFTIAVGEPSRLTINSFGTFGDFICQETGQISCPAFSLTVIETPVADFDSSRNFTDGILGRDTETDAEFRSRRLQSFQISGAATVEAIRSKLLQDVSGMTACSVFENATDVTNVDGVPPHAIWAVCEIADTTENNEAVAQKLWEVKAAGIETYGSVSVSVLDSMGFAHTINFDHPSNKYAWVKVAVNAYNTEEVLPTNWQTVIADNLVAYGQTLQMGNDLIVQKFFSGVMSVPGLSTVTLSVAITDNPGDTPSWSLVNIAVGKTTRALFATSRIVIIP